MTQKKPTNDIELLSVVTDHGFDRLIFALVNLHEEQQRTNDLIVQTLGILSDALTMYCKSDSKKEDDNVANII